MKKVLTTCIFLLTTTTIGTKQDNEFIIKRQKRGRAPLKKLQEKAIDKTVHGLKTAIDAIKSVQNELKCKSPDPAKASDKLEIIHRELSTDYQLIEAVYDGQKGTILSSKNSDDLKTYIKAKKTDIAQLEHITKKAMSNI